MKAMFDQLESYLFRIGLSPETVPIVLKCFSPKKYDKNDVFYSFGSNIQLGFICSGCFYMYSITDQDELHVKNFLGAEDFVLPTFGDQDCGEVTIQALTSSKVLVAEYKKIQEIGKSNLEFQSASKKGLEKHIYKICNRFQNIKMLPAGESYRLFIKEFSSIIKFIPQYLIASYLGITPTQLSRIRKKNT